MIAHIIVTILFIVLAYFAFQKCGKTYADWSMLYFSISIIAAILALIFFLWTIITPFEHLSFMKEYEVQQEMFEIMKESDLIKEDSLTYIVDIMDINKRLISLQANKQLWGWWSCWPDSILELPPIGVS